MPLERAHRFGNRERRRPHAHPQMRRRPGPEIRPAFGRERVPRAVVFDRGQNFPDEAGRRSDRNGFATDFECLHGNFCRASPSCGPRLPTGPNGVSSPQAFQDGCVSAYAVGFRDCAAAAMVAPALPRTVVEDGIDDDEQPDQPQEKQGSRRCQALKGLN